MRSLLAFLALGAALAAPAAGATAKASLRLVDQAPATVAGRGFRPRVALRVTLTANGTRSTRRLRASGTGAFVARFSEDIGHACDRGPVVIVAVAADGTRVSLKVPAPECPPGPAGAP